MLKVDASHMLDPAELPAFCGRAIADAEAAQSATAAVATLKSILMDVWALAVGIGEKV